MIAAAERVGRAARMIPDNVRALSWVSFANDMASELAYPVLPLFLRITLGAPVAVLGLIEGIAEGVSVGFRGIAGWLSDRSGARRKPWVVAGYSMTAVARPLLASAPHWGQVLAARLVDRAGKAARTAPRDALIRDSTPRELLGASFGFHRAADSAGAVVGPLVAVALLALGLSLRQVLWFTVAPAIATLVLLRAVREAPVKPSNTVLLEVEGEAPVSPRQLPLSFWVVLAVWVLFSLGNSADVFLLLRAANLGLSVTLTVLAYALYQLVYSTLSWPLGSLSDRVPRPLVLGGGLAVFALVYLGFAAAHRTWALWPLFAVYGCYMAATDGVAKAWVGDHAPRDATGTAYGIFAAATGAALLVASIVAGLLWSHVDPSAPFYMGAAAAGAGLLLLPIAAAR